MTEVKSDTKIRNRYPDRLTIDPGNLEKIGSLLAQLISNCPGCDANRKNILNWIVEKFPKELSQTDLKDLSDRFYDEERFLKLALEEVRAAKVRGDKLTLGEILQRKNSANEPVQKRRRRRKAEVGMGGETLISEDVAV